MLLSKKNSIKECDTNSDNNSGSPNWHARKLIPFTSVSAYFTSRNFSRQITAVVFIANFNSFLFFFQA
jgi:hypothetical protein